ncbi:MAG TPA: VWA domain-containing protein, partial [Actinoplanes sp.]|nr:VWA domain-containing protein [Actinoplanes sp.]
MSSSTPNRPDRARVATVLTALVTVLLIGAAPAAAVPLPVAAVFTTGGQTSVVVDLSASTSPGRAVAAVTRDGATQAARLVPVVSDDLAVALVVDTSAAGAATLPAWLSAAARFMLEAPGGTRAVVVADSAPAATVAGPHRGPLEIVRALDGIPARGERDTAAALTLAAGQFPDTPAGRRVVVYYTGAPDAGGESAAALAARFRSAGTLLVVVGSAAAGRYWAEAAAGTGGFFAPAGDPVVVPALDQVQTTLAGRYLVEFPAPPDLPARVSVRVDTGDLTLTGDAVVTAPPGDPGGWPNLRMLVLGGLTAAGLALAAALLLLARRRPRRTPAARPA